VHEEWKKSADIRKEIVLDEYVIMPTHMHALVWIVDVGEWRGERPLAPAVPVDEVEFKVRKRSLSSLMAGFKSSVTVRVKKLMDWPHGNSIWQRDYHGDIIRNERHLNAVRQYIEDNPHNWAHDPDHPHNITNRSQCND